LDNCLLHSWDKLIHQYYLLLNCRQLIYHYSWCQLLGYYYRLKLLHFYFLYWNKLVDYQYLLSWQVSDLNDLLLLITRHLRFNHCLFNHCLFNHCLFSHCLFNNRNHRVSHYIFYISNHSISNDCLLNLNLQPNNNLFLNRYNGLYLYNWLYIISNCFFSRY